MKASFEWYIASWLSLLQVSYFTETLDFEIKILILMICTEKPTLSRVRRKLKLLNQCFRSAVKMD